MGSSLNDLRYAIRTLWKHPGFTTVAVLTLALGIGANTAIFSIVNGVLFRALPYHAADRVVTVYGGDVDGRFGVSELERVRYREQTQIFQDFGAVTSWWVNLTGEGEAERVAAAGMNAEVLPLLGVSPIIGRAFDPEEDVPGQDGVAILSYELWQRRFGGDRAAMGKTLVVSGRPRTVIGVMPAGFRLPFDFLGRGSDLYVPLALSLVPDPRNFHSFDGVARLQDGVSVAQANRELAAVSQRLKEEIGTLPPTFVATAVPVRDEILGQVRPALMILLGAVGLVLLIACVNVANLLLARSEARLKEMSIRAAVGAGRLRLARQLLTESVLLGLVGGACGLLLAVWATHALVVLSPPNLPRIDEIGLDGRVFAFTMVVSVLTGVLFGLVPALHVARGELHEVLRGGGRGATMGRGGHRIRRTLVVAEMALALMLAIGAGLLIKSFLRLQEVESGFNEQRVLTMQLSLPFTKYPDAVSARLFYRQLVDRIRPLPGVERAGAVSHLPLSNNPGDWGIRIEGREEERLASGRRPWADWIVVTDEYFEALGVGLREGRFLSASDDGRAVPVVIINETTARRYWPNESAVGKRFKLSADIDVVYRTVVGVVADVKHRGLDAEVRPAMYLPHAQFPATATFPVSAMNLVLRTVGDPLALTGAVRRQVRALDSDVPISLVRTMEQVRARSTSVQRLNVLLFTAFGVLGLVLVAVGVYGVMAYAVAQRTRELGIRIALGAAPREVLGMIVGQGMMLALVGIGAGVLGALTMSRALAGILFGVSTHDVSTFLGIPVLLTAVALMACYLPARRATKVDPVEALRYE